MLTGRKYRLYPTPEQATVLGQWIGCARFVYNTKVNEEKYLAWLRHWSIFSPSWENIPEGDTTGTVDQSFGHLKGSKTEKPWLHQVPCQIYRNAIVQWKQGWSNHWQNPKHFNKPTTRKRGEADSIWLTNELFEFVSRGHIRVGTKTRDLGILFFKEHRRFRNPNSVTISRTPDGRWWLSLNFEDGKEQPKPQATREFLKNLSPEELAKEVIGHDRGIARTVQCSDGRYFTVSDAKKLKIEKWNRRIKALSKKLARQPNKASKRRAKTKKKLARTHSRIADMRKDQAHQISASLVKTPAKVLVFENLPLKNLVKKPKPIPKENGKGFKPNKARAKAGLNKALHHAGLGMILRFTRYKAERIGKIIILVPAHNSSRECSRCGHTHPANRKSQAQFHCQACAFTSNADANASVVLQKHGIAELLDLFRASGRGASNCSAEAIRLNGVIPFNQDAVEARISDAPTPSL
jgi:putative transposase